MATDLHIIKKLSRQRSLSQAKSFVAIQRVDLSGPKRTLPNVAVIGPDRKQTQVEISQSDAYLLGIPDTPLLPSGQLMTSGGGLTLKGLRGSIIMKTGVIIPMRHLHAAPKQAAKAGLNDGDYVSIKTFGIRSITLHNVLIRVEKGMDWSLHLDADEANALGYKKDEEGELIIEIAPKTT